jgi:hypothetical protein
MTVDEVVEDMSAAEQAVKQKEQAVKKQKANLQIQKAMAQYRKIANNSLTGTPPAKI